MRTPRKLAGSLLAVGILALAPACAPSIYRDRPGAEYRLDGERRAYKIGHDQGWKDGQNDARTGRGFAAEFYVEFRANDNGYGRRTRDRAEFRESFRSGFTDGYGEGYRANRDRGSRVRR